MDGLRIAFGVLMVATAFCFLWMFTLLSDEMTKGVYRSIRIYPYKLNEYVNDGPKLRRIRTVRAVFLISFIGLLVVFSWMLGANLAH